MTAQTPEWLAVLAAACAAKSQKSVAARLGVSATVVNQVLKGKYQGNTDRIRGLVEAVLMRRTVLCPVLGEISAEDCLRHQKRPFTPVNPTFVRLFRQCPECPNAQKRGE